MKLAYSTNGVMVRKIKQDVCDLTAPSPSRAHKTGEEDLSSERRGESTDKTA